MLALFLAAELRLADRAGFPLDDAWIHAVFARNVVEGHGFSFNAGELVGGSTSPLWTVAMAAVYAATHAMVWGTKALGAFLYLAGILLAYLFALQLTGDRATATLAGVLTALLRWNAWGAVGGMEVPLYVALSLAGLSLHVVAADCARARWLDLGSTLCLSLSALARPECLTLLGTTRLLAATDQLHRAPRLREVPRLLADLLPHVLVVAVVLAPWALFNYRTVGTLAPNTFNAKVGTQNVIAAIAARDLPSIVKTVLAGPVLHIPILILRLLATNAVLLPFAVLGFSRLWRQTGEDPLRARVRLLPAAFLLYPAAMSVVEPTAKLAYRYVTNLLVLYCLLGAAGLGAAWGYACDASSAGAGRIISRIVRPLAMAGVLLCVVAASTAERWTPLLGRLFLGLSSAVAAAEYERTAERLLRPGLVAAAAFGSLIWVFATPRRLRVLVATLGVLCVLSQAGLALVAARRYAIQVRDINDLHIACGEWIDRHLPPGVTLALDDIGGITYACRRQIVDMAGLVSPEAITCRREGRSRVDYLRTVQPDFIATIHPRDFVEAPGLFRPIHLLSIRDNIASADDTMVVFETVWNRWQR